MIGCSASDCSRKSNQERERSVDSLGAPDPVVMREDRQLLEMIVAFLDSELAAENGIAATGVDEITGANIFGRPVLPNPKIDMFVREFNAICGHFFVHFSPAFTRVIK